MSEQQSQTKITRRRLLTTLATLIAGAGFFKSIQSCESKSNEQIKTEPEKNKITMKKIISTKNAPGAIGPYSQAVMINGFLYTSGQICINPENGELVMDSIQNETHQVMKNLKAILTEAGMDFSHVIKTGIFLQSMNDFATVNDIYASYFTSDYPARETVEVAKLPKGVNVEISMVAYKG